MRSSLILETSKPIAFYYSYLSFGHMTIVTIRWSGLKLTIAHLILRNQVA